MSYHQDPEIEAAYIRLCDALCSWEGATGRESTLILVPHAADEKIRLARDGKPVPMEGSYPTISLIQTLEFALKQRGDDWR